MGFRAAGLGVQVKILHRDSVIAVAGKLSSRLRRTAEFVARAGAYPHLSRPLGAESPHVEGLECPVNSRVVLVCSGSQWN